MNSHLNPDEKTLTLRVSGDLVSTAAEPVRNEVLALFGGAASGPPKWTTFILDLTTAKMVDSVGLNLVVSMLKRVQARGAKMRITYSSQDVLRTLNFTRLDKHIELVKA
jgi:anti-anti-sigma factor